MSVSVATFTASIIISQRLRKYSKLHSHPDKERLFTFALYISIFLFVVEVAFHFDYIVKWIWYIFVLILIQYWLRQKELNSQRMLLWSILPLVLFALLSDLVNVVTPVFFVKWGNYFDYVVSFSYIWMIAVLFMQNRQNKATEKERTQRQQQNELNEAIAIRKVELEALVAERTRELTGQKEELEHTLNQLRSTQTQLIQSEKMASLGELTAGIAHEIQNPLNFVNNFSEINNELIAEMKEEIEKGNYDAAKALAKDIQENEQKIVHHGKRADAIVKGMLQHSRSTSGIKEPTDINALADEYLRLSYHGLRAKDKTFNATMKTNFDPTIGKVNMVPQDMGRVILNLLTNAFYVVNEKKKMNITGYEPTISLTTKKLHDKVEINVTDNGNGIPLKVLEKIFQPFFTTKPTGEGTGLGLSLSYDIVTKAHGGELKVETKEGEGTTFTIALPQLLN